MTSPFPGLDPFLESQGYWPDFHLKFINYLQEALADALPEGYEVRIDERMNLVKMPREETRQILLDVAIVNRGIAVGAPQAGSVALLAEPVTIPIPILDEDPEVYLEIFHRPERTLVAVIEVLSPGNKAGTGVVEYLAKRNAVLRQEVHLVELDFLVGGRRLPMRQPLPPGDYYAFVARGDHRPDCQVYSWSVRQRLPAIKVPLIAPDPDVTLDLARVFATAFERGRYARSIDYTAPLTIPLAPADLAWARETVRTALH